MIDTMIIYHRCSGAAELFSTLGKVAKYMSEHNLKSVHNNITYGGAHFGFEEIQFVHRREHRFYAINIKLRPKLLICKNNYINTLYPSDIPMLVSEFARKAKKLGLPNTDILTYSVKRIDYAVDINIESGKIPRYIALFKQGAIPENLMNEYTMRYFDSDTNMYLIGTNFNVNFYDRYRTLIEKQKNYESLLNIIKNQHSGQLFLTGSSKEQSIYKKYFSDEVFLDNLTSTSKLLKKL